MTKLILPLLLSLVFLSSVSAQYGNEWIDFNKTYYKFKVAEDGVYRIPASVLAEAGLGDVPGSQFRLYRLGTEVPVYTSSDGVFSTGDYIEFVGEQNRGEFDRALYQDPDMEQLNPEYSMFTDTAAYFLTWDVSGTGARIVGIDNDLTNLPAVEPYYMQYSEWIYTDHVVDPRNAPGGSGVSFSRYQEGEGFGAPDYSTFHLDLPVSMPYTTGPEAEVRLRMATSTYTAHDVIARIDNDTLGQSNLSAFHLLQFDKTISSGGLTGDLALSVADAAANGAFSISLITWAYPRLCDFTGKAYAEFLHQGTDERQYFELANFDHEGMDPVVIDRNAGMRLVAGRAGNTVRFLLPAFSGQRDLVIASQASGIHTIGKLTARTFTDYSGDNKQYVIITHPSLMSGQNVVSQYAQYRSSPAGGGYDVGVYTIQNLYDQFGYGISKHPQAIRNFSRMIVEKWPAVKMMLIIGKAVSYAYSRTPGSDGDDLLLVPTFGQPGADNLLLTENGTSLPPFPIGRLPVTNATQLQTYLDKLKEYDQVDQLPQTLAARGWTKQILHMGGGQDADQQDQILGCLNNMADVAINSPFGAQVETFTKSSTSSTGQSNSDRIVQILHDGTSVVKFYGHSSSSTLDFQINTAADWQNKGKYPIFSAMGCKAGDIHQDFKSLSEQFVFTPDAGTIAFIAGSGPQYQNTLCNWGIDWYTSFGYQFDSLTLGETLRESLGMLNQFGTTPEVLLIEQETLNGDPALRFHHAPGPDYLWDYESVQYVPQVITTDMDSFTLSADIVNIGLNIPDSVSVVIDQKTPDGSIYHVYQGSVDIHSYRTTLSVRLPVIHTASGVNTYYFTVDNNNAITELPDPAAEENNELVDANGKKGFDIFILDNRARATRPLEFSIVTDQVPVMIASSTNAFVKGETFVMELDTTPQFDSPVFLREFFSDFFGIVKWKPVYPYVPGKVYYWRVSAVHGDSRLWDTSSFLYQPGGQRGWNQSHYGQFQRDVLTDLDFDNAHVLAFDTIYRNIWVQNKVDFDPGLEDDPVVYINNNLRRDFFTFYKSFDANVFIVAVDSFTGRFLKNPPGGAYGAVNTGSTNINVFPYNTATQEGRGALMSFLENQITDGMYAIIYTYQRPGYMTYFPEDWEADEQTLGKSIFSVIESQAPGSQIRDLADKGSVPYLLFYRKNRSLIYEGIANQLEETISFDYNFISHATTGDILSTMIGPARQWKEFIWANSYSEEPVTDEFTGTLVAYSKSLSDSLEIDVTALQDTNLTFIDAAEYPFIKLKFHTDDLTHYSPARLDFWRILYEGMPDLLINPGGGFVFEADSLMVGQPMHFTTSVENVGEALEDSTQVRFTITDSKNASIIQTEGIPPLASGESTMIQLSRADLGAAGNSSLLIEVNADHAIAEASFLNNTGLLHFTLIPDRRNPALDVTVDGRHLINGDIVSTTPVILAQLADDNPYLLLDDKGAFSVYLRYPNDFDYTQIDLDSPDIQFTPATVAQPNLASLKFTPTLEDGYYDLLIQAEDRSQNDAGNLEYRVSFEVLGNPLMTRVDVQPTWFNDYTQFIFTVSGTQPPTDISLEIANAAGQIVRTIGKDEIGLFVGTTEYTWDGTTDSGQKLPSGVYFYRLTAKDRDGRDYELLGPGSSHTRRAARAGKLVIVR